MHLPFIACGGAVLCGITVGGIVAGDNISFVTLKEGNVRVILCHFFNSPETSQFLAAPKTQTSTVNIEQMAVTKINLCCFILLLLKRKTGKLC
jgi:hypothetical protein